MLNFQGAYLHLADMAMNSGTLWFAYPVKGHYFEHLVRRHAGLVPSRIWCYRYEDFMGRLVQCAQRCIQGSALTQIGRKVSENYRMAGCCCWSISHQKPCQIQACCEILGLLGSNLVDQPDSCCPRCQMVQKPVVGLPTQDLSVSC